MIIYRFRPDRVYDGEVQVPGGTTAIPKYHTFDGPPPYDPTSQHAVFVSGGWMVMDGPAPEYPNPAVVKLQQSEIVRMKRNDLLSNCDWTQLADAPLIQVEKDAWATYRQELRDVTNQEGFPLNVVWPNPPVAPTTVVVVVDNQITDSVTYERPPTDPVV